MAYIEKGYGMKDGYDAAFSLGYAPEESFTKDGYKAVLRRFHNTARDDNGRERHGGTWYYYVWNIWKNGRLVGSLQDKSPSPNPRDYSPGSLDVTDLPMEDGRNVKLNFEGDINDAIDYIHLITLKQL